MINRKSYTKLKSLYEDDENSIVYGSEDAVKAAATKLNDEISFFYLLKNLDINKMPKDDTRTEKLIERLDHVSEAYNVSNYDLIKYIQNPVSLKISPNQDIGLIKSVNGLIGMHSKMIAQQSLRVSMSRNKLFYTMAHPISESFQESTYISEFHKIDKLEEECFRKESLTEAVKSPIGIKIAVWIYLVLIIAVMGLSIYGLIQALVDNAGVKKYNNQVKQQNAERGKAVDDAIRDSEKVNKEARDEIKKHGQDNKALKKMVIDTIRSLDKDNELRGVNLDNMSVQELEKLQREMKDKAFTPKVSDTHDTSSKYAGAIDVDYKEV